MTEEERQALLAELAARLESGATDVGPATEPPEAELLRGMSNEDLELLAEAAAAGPPQFPEQATQPPAQFQGLSPAAEEAQRLAEEQAATERGARTVMEGAEGAPQGFWRDLTSGQLIPTELGAAGGGRRGPSAVAELQMQPPPVGMDLLQAGTANRMQGAAGAAQAQADEAAATLGILADEAERDRIAAEHYDRIVQEHVGRADAEMGEISELLDLMQTRRIDPNRLWADSGEGSRFGAMMAVAGGYLAQVYTGVPNEAAAIVRQAINRDIQAQMSDQEQQRAVLSGRMSLLQTMRQRYQDEEAALLATRAIKTQEAINRLRAISNTFKGPQAFANLQQVVGQLQQELVVQVNALHENRLKLGLRGDPRLVLEQFQSEVDQRFGAHLAEREDARLQAQAVPQTVPGAPTGVPQPGSRPGRQSAIRLGTVQEFARSEQAQHPPPAGFAYVSRAGEAFMIPAPAPGVYDFSALGQRQGEFSPAETMQVHERFGEVAPESLPEGAHLYPGGAELWRAWRNTEQGRGMVGLLHDWRGIEEDVALVRSFLDENKWMGSLGDLVPAEVRARAAQDRLLAIEQRIRRFGQSDALQTSEAHDIRNRMGGGAGERFNFAANLDAFDDWIRSARRAAQAIARPNGLIWNPEALADLPVQRLPDLARRYGARAATEPREQPAPERAGAASLGGRRF